MKMSFWPSSSAHFQALFFAFKLQAKNRWDVDSAWVPYNRQWGGTFKSQLLSLSRVVSLSRKTIQEKNACFRILSLNQTIWCHETADAWGFSEIHVLAVEKSPGKAVGELLQRNTSSCKLSWVGTLSGKQLRRRAKIGCIPLGSCQTPSLQVWMTLVIREKHDTVGPEGSVRSINGPKEIQSSCQNRATLPEWIWQRR